MLEVHGVSKTFDGFSAVDRVDFSIARGEIAAVIGPNGAGKSTFFNLITGHLRPDVGRILLKERDITGAPPHRICLMGMGRSFQRTNIFPKLTVFENVQAAFITHRRRGANFWGLSDRLYRAETDALLASLGLADKANALSGALSHGNQKQVELGIALACDPEILLLDEPTAGMSAAETRETIRLLERIAAERSLTLLFTEHDMEVVFSIAQKIAVLHQGRLIAEGKPEAVQQNADVRRVYLESGIDGAFGSARPPYRLRRGARPVWSVAAGGARGMRVPARTQRRRQNHHPAIDHGADAAEPGIGPVAGTANHRLGTAPRGPTGHRLRAGGSAHFRRAHHLGKFGCGPPRLRAYGTVDHRKRVRAISEARRVA